MLANKLLCQRNQQDVILISSLHMQSRISTHLLSSVGLGPSLSLTGRLTVVDTATDKSLGTEAEALHKLMLTLLLFEVEEVSVDLD